MKGETCVYLFTDTYQVPRTLLGHAGGTQLTFTEYRNELSAIVHRARGCPCSVFHHACVCSQHSFFGLGFLDPSDMKVSWRQGRNHLSEPKKPCREQTCPCTQHIQTDWHDPDEPRAPSKSCSLTAIVFRPLAVSPPSTTLGSERDARSPSGPAGRLMFSIRAVPQTSYFHCYDYIFNVPVFNGSKLPDLPAPA